MKTVRCVFIAGPVFQRHITANALHYVADYIVPSMPRVVDEETLYRDAQDPKARATIEEHIKAIREQRQTFRVPTETATMPINNRVGFDNHECGLPPRPESRQPRP